LRIGCGAHAGLTDGELSGRGRPHRHSPGPASLPAGAHPHRRRRLRVLLTNDDGIHADGLAALERIADQLSDDVWICAPEYEQSGASRALTLAEPIRVRTLSE